MHEVTSDPKSFKGSAFHRLFQRAFPGHFKFNFIYLWHPFCTFKRNMVLARKQGYTEDIAEKAADSEDAKDEAVVDIKRLTESKRPAKHSAAQEVTDYQSIRGILVENKDQYVHAAIRDEASVLAGALRTVLTASDDQVAGPSKAFEDFVDGKHDDLFFDYRRYVTKNCFARASQVSE